jgi:hypothetical protein
MASLLFWAWEVFDSLIPFFSLIMLAKIFVLLHDKLRE